MIPNRFEIYAIVLVAILLVGTLCSVGAYFKGRSDERDANQQKVLADNAAKMAGYETKLQDRAKADDSARDRALQFVDDISKRMDNVNAKFAKIPTVVLDARGCERLTDSARLRWNAVELVPAGPSLDQAGNAPGSLQPAAVPAK